MRIFVGAQLVSQTSGALCLCDERRAPVNQRTKPAVGYS